MSETQKPITVSELSDLIKQVVETSFPPLWIVGEVSDLVRARSGHIYFTLKDESAQIRGVIWRTAASRLKFKIENGQSLICFGNVEVYTIRGTYQLVVRDAEPLGVGALQLAFQQLQQKLNAEGLFAAERKKTLPRFPNRIGVVTSPTGAAIRDFLQAASERYSGMKILVIPSLVQGDGAAESIAKAIRTANRINPPLDILVITRGGGSLEDLWSFNEEPVVRAVAESIIPTVSAVGHEIDITLCDMAADVRALTPTDAATRVMPDGQGLIRFVADMRARLDRSMMQMITSRRERLLSLGSRRILGRPMDIIHMRSRQLDELDARARRAVTGQLEMEKAKVQKLAASLSALSPLNVLARGYSVTLDADGCTIEGASKVNVGDAITTRLNEGEIRSTVTKSQPGQ